MKNYYAILGVSESSDEEEIRKNYRTLAMQYHPDRNPDSQDAEEKFKELAEAYGVLTDPVKRREYDVMRQQGHANTKYSHSSGGFSYSQEDILRDLFKDPRFQQVMAGLLREFGRSGFRSSPAFLRRCFMGGKGGFVFGGLFFFGAMFGPTFLHSIKRGISGRASIVKSITGVVSSFLGMEREVEAAGGKGADIIYHLSLTTDELQQGKWIQVALPVESGQELLKVNVPPGSQAGRKLRLPGKGQCGSGGRGDLYLFLEKS